MTEVADLYVVLRSVGKQFEAGMAAAGASAERADGKIASVAAGAKTMALATAGAGLLVAGAALKMSGAFDRAMEQIHTLAHVPQGEIKTLSSHVLNLAGQVGFAPTSLAEALYHVESTFASVGITGKKALDILKVGAEGAQIGHASLVDVMNALDAAVVSGIPGAENINKAMGALLATVGAGDMTMQNLADALGSGILAVVKQYGVTLNDTGAALATFGDNNIRGSKAATDLRMVIMDLVKQNKPGMQELASLGIKYGQLGDDMRSGGLMKAIVDLKTHLAAAGITGNQVGKVLTDVFTKRASAPLAILMGEFNQFSSKYPELAKGASSFGDSWKHTAQLMALQAQMAKSNIEAAFIGLGHMLAPVATLILKTFNGAFEWAKTHKKTIQELADKLKFVLVGALIIVGTVLAGMAVEALIAAAPFIALAAAVGFVATWLYKLYEHNAKFRGFVNNIVTWFKQEIPKAVHFLVSAFEETKKVIGEVIDAIVGFYERHKKAIDKMVRDAWSLLKKLWTVFVAGFDAIKAVVQTVIKVVVNLWNRFGDTLWQHIVTAWNAIVQVVRGAFNIVKGIFEVVTGILTGNWSKFWKGIKDILGGAWDVIVGIFKTALNLISTISHAMWAVVSATWGLVWHTIEHVAENAWSLISRVAKAIWSWMGSIGSDINKAFAGAARWLFNAGRDIIYGLGRGIASVADALYQWFLNMPIVLGNVVEKGYNYMLQVGKDLITGIWNGIASLAQWLWNKVESFCSDIWNGILDYFGINSPSKLMKDTVGKHIVTGIAAGIEENKHMVHKSLKKLADDAARTNINVGGFGSANGGGHGKSGSVPGGRGSVGTGNTIVHVTVQGNVIDTAGLFKAMQTATQQHGARNPSNGLAYRR